LDNTIAESFFATIKRELIDGRAWPTRAGLHRAVLADEGAIMNTCTQIRDGARGRRTRASASQPHG
jgi:hypothetical protein